MRTLIHIFILITVVSFFVIYNFSGANKYKIGNEIVIVGNDTLGRNWDNLPSAKEIEENRFKHKGSNVINYEYNNDFGQNSTSNNQKGKPNTFESIGFSNKISESQNNKVTVISESGAEIVVGTY